MTDQIPTPTSVEATDPARVDGLVRASMARLRSRAPFFGTLAMYARFIARPDIDTAATDGLDVMYNPTFFDGLEPQHLDAVIAHEVLHAALDHVYRRGSRDAMRWNYAADVVVNGLIAGAGMELPEGALRSAALERYSTEEVYVALEREGRDGTEESFDVDLIEDPNSAADGKPGRTPSRRDQAARHWAAAIDRAAAVTRTRERGDLPGGITRAFDLADRPKLDWRTLLWRFVTRTPTDFASFDRRQIYRGLYLETLESQSVKVVVAVDTSGSVDSDDLNAFVGELQGLLGAYPQLQAWLIYCDTEAYGPYRLELGGDIPPPEGGGGTDFAPVFECAAEHDLVDEGTVAVYLTDGFGSFPDPPPSYPVLWIVTPAGLESDGFPFGEVTRLGDT
jgi:predicted metal-dependent peptidase